MAATDRNQRIDSLQTGLKGHGHRRAVHDGWRRSLDRQALTGAFTGPLLSSELAERVYDSSQQSVADGHVHHSPRSPDFVARVQMRIVAEQHHSDFTLVQVKRDA